MGSGASVDNITPEAIAETVASFGGAYEKYRENIEYNGLNGEILADIENDQELEGMLESIDITNMLHKKNLIKQYRKWRETIGGSYGVASNMNNTTIPPEDSQQTMQISSSMPKLSAAPPLSHNIPFQETLTIGPRDILYDMFQIQGISLDPQDIEPAGQHLCQAVKERCTSSNEGMIYDCFISYRVASECDLAEKLYLLLKLQGLNPFWDKKCLSKGEDWKAAFLTGLQHSKSYIALISNKALSSSKDLLKDHSTDNFLLEMQIALKIRQMTNNSSFIIPVHVGEYIDVEGEGMILKKFTEFNCNFYAPSVVLSPPQRASILATRAAEIAESNRCNNGSHKEYTDGYYEGDLIDGEIRHGYGVFEITSGSLQGFYYAGEWKNDQQSGHGISKSKLKLFEGLSYAGEWRNNSWNGYGIQTFPEGICLEGQFQDSTYVFSSVSPRNGSGGGSHQSSLLKFRENSSDESDQMFVAYTTLQNPPSAILSTLFRPFMMNSNSNQPFSSSLPNSLGNDGHGGINQIIDWDPEDPQTALDKASKVILSFPNLYEREESCFIVYRKHCMNDMSCAMTLSRYLEIRDNGITVYPYDYYRTNQKITQKNELEKAMKSVKCVVIMISNESVKPCRDCIATHIDDEYLMQIEAVLRAAMKCNPMGFNVIPIFIGEYFDIPNYGRVLQKFRVFDEGQYSNCIEVNEAGKAAYYARIAAQKSNAMKDTVRHSDYEDGAYYEGEFRDGDIKEGHGVYKGGSTNVFLDNWLKWPAGVLYAGEFKDNSAHGYGVVSYGRLGTYEGMWMNGKKHGYGIRYYSYGLKVEGRWDEDVFIK